MYIDDKKAVEMIIEQMEIKGELDNIRQLHEWIEKEGIEKVFILVHDMYKKYI